MKKDGYQVTEVTCDNEVVANWDSNNWGINITENPNHVNRIKCSVNFEVTLSNYIMLKSEYDKSVVQEEHEKTDQTEALTDYRFIGANPNNYVCLEESGQCTEEELYRIIGVIPIQSSEEGPYENRVKLVKNTRFSRNYWSGSSSNRSNDWTKSTLNKDILNGTYWSEIGKYQKYIDSAKWYLGGISGSEYLVSDLYKNERGNTGGYSSPNTIYIIANVGLVYPSDAGYATNGDSNISRNQCLAAVIAARKWSSSTGYQTCASNDWLMKSNGCWTIIPDKNNILAITFISGINGGISSDNVTASNQQDVYPSFYLKTGVKYASGTGEKDNPYRVMID